MHWYNFMRGEQEHINDQSFFVTLLYMITIKSLFCTVNAYYTYIVTIVPERQEPH